jgi:hypothetical protein
MIYVLGSAIILTNLLWGVHLSTSEGLTNKTELTYDEFKEKVVVALVTVDTDGAERENLQFVKIMKSLQEIRSKPYYDAFKTNYIKLKDHSWVDENILEFGSVVVIDNPKQDDDTVSDHLKKSLETPSGYDENESLKGVNSSYPSEKSDLLERVKKTTPELTESLQTLKGMDMDQINKLINNLNKVMETF